MLKVISSDVGLSAAEYGFIASLASLATIIGFQSVSITLAAMVQTAAVSISIAM